MNSDLCGVYQIKCVTTGKIYVGSSKRIYRRWHEHRKALRRGTSNCRYLQRAWTKYGEDAFEFQVTEVCAIGQLESREQWHIDQLCPKLNVLTNVSARLGPDMLERRTATLRARAAAQTHCLHGHEYTEENTYRDKRGKRCRACARERTRQVLAKETAEQRALRRKRVAAYKERSRAETSEYMRLYTVTTKERKRAYDVAHLAEKRARRLARWAAMTDEQRNAERARKRDSYHRNRVAA